MLSALIPSSINCWYFRLAPAQVCDPVITCDPVAPSAEGWAPYLPLFFFSASAKASLTTA
jgi:hypothetical protein